MAYNPLTKLLLKFNEGSGSTASADTSDGGRSVTITDGQVSSANGVFGTNSLEVGDPYGSGVFSYATVDSPAGVWSTSRSSVKRFDCWYFREANQQSGVSPIVSISFANNDTLSVWRGAVGIEVEIASIGFDGLTYNYAGINDYEALQGWHHLRFVIDGPNFALAIDGSEVIAFANSTEGEDLWVGDETNPINEIAFGCYPLFYGNTSAYFRGHLDAIEFTEGDTSWLGGSYTVPTAEPDDYAGGGAPELFGNGVNTLDALTSYGTDSLPEITGSGESTLDEVVGLGTSPLPEITGGGGAALGDVLSEGLGTTLGELSGGGQNEVEVIASGGSGTVVSDIVAEGATSLDDVTGKGVGGGKDITTTLMLHCNTGQETLDSSAHALTVTGVGTWGASANSWLNGSAQFQKLSGFGGYFSIPQQGGLFADPATDKIIDFRFRRLGTVGYETIFSVGFSASNYFSLLLNDSGELIVECITPDFTLVATVASGITFGIWRHARVAVVGNALYVCINGAQVYSTTSASALLWPQNSACTGLAIGQMFPPQAWAGLNANIDEFRIQEGFFTDHGYAGGSFTPPTYEWFPGQVLGNGANTVTVESVGEVKEYAHIYGSGATTLYDTYQVGSGRFEYPVSGGNTTDEVVSYGHTVSGVYISALGTTTVEGMAGSGHTVVLPVVSGQAAFALDDTTSEGTGGISWSARGANAISVASEGFGVGPAWCVGSGKNTVVTITSQGTSAAGPRFANGENTVTVTSIGYGDASLLRGQGSNTADVISAAQGSVLCRGYGENSVSVASSGVSALTVSGYATSLCGVSSFGAGAALIQGYGSGYVRDVFTRPDYPENTDHLFVLTKIPHIFTTKRNNTMTVRDFA